MNTDPTHTTPKAGTALAELLTLPKLRAWLAGQSPSRTFNVGYCTSSCCAIATYLQESGYPSANVGFAGVWNIDKINEVYFPDSRIVSVLYKWADMPKASRATPDKLIAIIDTITGATP